jgi:hypothetical protein
MRTPRLLWMPVAAVLALAGCQDATGPAGASHAPAYEYSAPYAGPEVNYLRQAPTAPALETYEVSFWAHEGQRSVVTVNYLPTGDASVGQPFLRFEIPRNGLATDASGQRFKRGDSVLVTLTIDPVNFEVDFQPSGLRFARGRLARLTLWYQNADPDLNGDGVVDAVDAACRELIALWGRATGARWVKLPTDVDRTLPSVSPVLSHFSEYAVSW